MGVASRKTWLERQSDEVQLAVLAMDDAGATLAHMREAIKQSTGEDVPASTLHNAIKIFREGIGHEEKLAALLARRKKRFFMENPDVSPQSIAHYLLTMASAKLDLGKLDDKSRLIAAQEEARIELRKQELEIKREANRLRERKLEQENRALRLKLNAADAQRARERRAVSEAIASEKKDPNEALSRIREIYGIFDRPAPGHQANAVSGSVDQG